MGTPGRKKTGRKSKRASVRQRTKPGPPSPPKQRTISVKEVNRRTRRMSVDFMSEEVGFKEARHTIIPKIPKMLTFPS
jgi:hypothetical protein